MLMSICQGYFNNLLYKVILDIKKSHTLFEYGAFTVKENKVKY